MPFPTVEEKSVPELAMDLFKAIDATSTQLYADVQRLKVLAKAHGWDIETDDPSQAPIA